MKDTIQVMVCLPEKTSTTRMLRILIASALLSALGGCVGLEVANVALQTGNTIVSDLIPAQRMTVVSNELESATPATYKPYVYRSGQDCIFSAFVVPYDRTWPEEVRQGDSGDVRILPPEPGKIAGYIAIVYKKDCPGMASEPVLRAGRQSTVSGTGTILTRAFSSDKTTYFMSTWDSALDSRDMLASAPDKPLWWPQVVERLARLANTDPAIKEMLASNTGSFVKAAPEQAAVVRAALR